MQRRLRRLRLAAVPALCLAAALAGFDPPLGIYHYRFLWQGAPVARADVEVRREGD